MKKLAVAFLWHFHQPFYKDNISNFYYLPWVRLHGTKGYWDMINVLEEIKEAKVTFNISGCLLKQLKDISEHEIKDKFLALSLRDASDLAEEEKEFILNNFFMANWKTMISPIKRYQELFQKKSIFFSYGEAFSKLVKNFTIQDIRDLQVLFNLSWCGFTLRNKDKFIQELFKKGSNFTEEEKKELLNKQKEIISSIISTYKRMQDENQIEISTSPFYHPILPLLCQEPGYSHGFDFKEDAKMQVQKAVKFYKQIFGREPVGFWPSEGAVSQNTIPLYANAGVSWIVSDEEILMNSEKEEGNLYKFYFVEEKGTKLNIVFRDKELSNLISFVYGSQNSKSAVDDMILRLQRIREKTAVLKGNHIVVIALDGENPWEYYPNSGETFLKELYESICQTKELELVTISDFLKQHSPEGKIKKLYSGSWIDHSFRIWIGKPEKDTAWDYLNRTRNDLLKTAPENKEAWEEIYISEGSDWFWWFDDDFFSCCDEIFDLLFRLRLMNVYRILQLPIPSYLKKPISIFNRSIFSLPSLMEKPVIDGKVTSFYEWLNAGCYYVNNPPGTLYCSYNIIKRFFYGYDINSLYFQIEFNPPLKEIAKEEVFIIIVINQFKQVVISLENKTKYILENLKQGIKKEIENFMQIEKNIELEIPFSLLKINLGEQINFFIEVRKKEKIQEKWPRTDCIILNLPTEENIVADWYV